MPVSGQTGTLATAYGRYVTKHARCAQGDVHAKTGSLFDTIALSGVAETTSGGERLFSLLVNDRPQRYSALSTRQALDGLTATITGCWD
jgi:D-alanyl-D-alanine carboxypeptidase